MSGTPRPARSAGSGCCCWTWITPTVVRSRSPEWVLGPTEPYELTGNVPGVVFPSGLTHHPDTDELRLYYGAANTCIAMATAQLTDVVAHLLADHTTQPRG